MSESGTTALSPDGHYWCDGYGWLPVVPVNAAGSGDAATTAPTAFGTAPARAHRGLGRRTDNLPKLRAVIAVVIAVALGAVVMVARGERNQRIFADTRAAIVYARAHINLDADRSTD